MQTHHLIESIILWVPDPFSLRMWYHKPVGEGKQNVQQGQLTRDISLVQLFAEFDCPWVRKQFGMQFSILLDTISVFQSSLSQSDLVLKFPGANEELVCE